jgi:hypothetical protein
MTIAATKYLTQDANSKIIRKTGRSKNEKQYADRCECIHIKENGSQFGRYHTASIYRELRNRFIFACNWEHPS